MDPVDQLPFVTAPAPNGAQPIVAHQIAARNGSVSISAGVFRALIENLANPALQTILARGRELEAQSGGHSFKMPASKRKDSGAFKNSEPASDAGANKAPRRAAGTLSSRKLSLFNADGSVHLPGAKQPLGAYLSSIQQQEHGGGGASNAVDRKLSGDSDATIVVGGRGELEGDEEDVDAAAGLRALLAASMSAGRPIGASAAGGFVPVAAGSDNFTFPVFAGGEGARTPRWASNAEGTGGLDSVAAAVLRVQQQTLTRTLGGTHGPPKASWKRLNAAPIEPGVGDAGAPGPGSQQVLPKPHHYKGVTRHRKTGRFEGHLWYGSEKGQEVGGRQIYLGTFESATVCAAAYDIAALLLPGGRKRIQTNFSSDAYAPVLETLNGATAMAVVGAIRNASRRIKSSADADVGALIAAIIAESASGATVADSVAGSDDGQAKLE